MWLCRVQRNGNELEEANTRLIPDVVNALLAKYHKLHGLGVIGWFREGVGLLYYSFYSLAVRDRQERPLYWSHVHSKYSLTIYQDRIGLPAWGAGQQWEHPDSNSRLLDIDELLYWYEYRLDLDSFFADFAELIDAWHNTRQDVDSERYLLTWQVVGILAAQWRLAIVAHEYLKVPRLVLEAMQAAEESPTQAVHRVGPAWLCSSGVAYWDNGDRLDLGELRAGGRSPQEIAETVASMSGIE